MSWVWTRARIARMSFGRMPMDDFGVNRELGLPPAAALTPDRT